MQNLDRKTLRLASQIRDRVLAGRHEQTTDIQYELDHLVRRIEQLALTRRQLALCDRHALPHAAQRVCSELLYVLRELPYEVSRLEQLVPRDPPEGPNLGVSLRDLVQDLDQIQEEFVAWEFRRSERVLAVTTEPIELEGVYLGAFEVRLHLDLLGHPRGRSCYEVVALDPHPPSCNDAVTHPHVSDDHLCEGDAAAPIRAALETGRLCDFFLLVRSVLTTYNSGSPYVRLDDWEGESCPDCGHLMNEDERYFCESCEQSFCGDCVGGCASCGLSICLGCLKECAACGEKTCSDCLKPCPECGESCCPSCRNPDDLCPTCQEAQELENTDEPEPAPAPGSEVPGALEAPNRASPGAARATASDAESGEAPDAGDADPAREHHGDAGGEEHDAHDTDRDESEDASTEEPGPVIERAA